MEKSNIFNNEVCNSFKSRDDNKTYDYSEKDFIDKFINSNIVKPFKFSENEEVNKFILKFCLENNIIYSNDYNDIVEQYNSNQINQQYNNRINKETADELYNLVESKGKLKCPRHIDFKTINKKDITELLNGFCFCDMNTLNLEELDFDKYYLIFTRLFKNNSLELILDNYGNVELL